jgi:protein SCO1/2
VKLFRRIGTRWTAIVCCALAVASLSSAAHEPDPPPLKFDRSSDGWPVPDFSLVDQNGDELTRHRLLGQWSFLLFGDTACASPCTTALSTLTALRLRIAGTRAVHSTQVVFVSLDPVRDDAARLKTYLAPFDQDIVAATGAPQMLKAFADELGATQRIDAASGHDGSLVLVGPEGNVRAVYLPPYDVRRLTADYLMKRARRR